MRLRVKTAQDAWFSSQKAIFEEKRAKKEVEIAQLSDLSDTQRREAYQNTMENIQGEMEVSVSTFTHPELFYHARQSAENSPRSHNPPPTPGYYYPEEELWCLFTQLLEGVLAVHKNHIIHRDLKSSNIFLQRTTTAHEGKAKAEDCESCKQASFSLRIGDFGVARVRFPDEVRW